MKTKLLVLLFSVVMVTALAQETCIRYSAKITPTSGYSGGFRDELCYDQTYGVYPFKAYDPYQLGIVVGGELKVRWEALRELRKPIWGEFGNQTFADALPVYIASVPEFFTIEEHPWYSIDTLPNLPMGHELVPFGYELRAPSGGDYMIFQGSSLEMAIMLLNMGYVTEWRPWNRYAGRSIMKVPNPEYPIVEAQRAQMVEQYETIISETFVQVADYVFPKFYYPRDYISLKWWIKYPGDTEYTEVEPDRSHPLASSSPSGPIKKRVIVREEEMKAWSRWIPITIMLSGDARVKKLLGL